VKGNLKLLFFVNNFNVILNKTEYFVEIVGNSDEKAVTVDEI